MTKDPSHGPIPNQAHVLITTHASSHTPSHTLEPADNHAGMVHADIHAHDLLFAHGHSHPGLTQTFSIQQGLLAPVET